MLCSQSLIVEKATHGADSFLVVPQRIVQPDGLCYARRADRSGLRVRDLLTG
jgi:hypothetical protein